MRVDELRPLPIFEGLTDAQLRDDYRFYTDHFDVDIERTS